MLEDQIDYGLTGYAIVAGVVFMAVMALPTLWKWRTCMARKP